MPARSGPLRPHPYCHPPRRAPTDRAAVICARQKEGVAPSYRESRRGSRFYIDDEAWSRRTWQKACGLWMDAKDHQVRGLWLLHTVPMADISSRWRPPTQASLVPCQTYAGLVRQGTLLGTSGTLGCCRADPNFFLAEGGRNDRSVAKSSHSDDTVRASHHLETDAPLARETVADLDLGPRLDPLVG